MVEDVEKIRPRLKGKSLPEFELPPQRQIDIRSAESPQGISTEIGSRKGEVPWGKVRLVENAGRHVLIVGATGNAFLIPGRAFGGPEQQAQFVQEVNSFQKKARLLSLGHPENDHL